jgi:hypothetical protein
MDKKLPAKYLEAIYELEYDQVAGRWKHQLFYHQLAAKLTWQGCKSGQPAKIQTIVDMICEDPINGIQMVQKWEQDHVFRRECYKEARQRPPNAWEESRFPGLSLRRCPSCLGAVPRQSVRCLSCWGYLMTQEDAIEEIRVVETAKEDSEKTENIVLTRRTAQDIEWNVNGEFIQMPCLDVQRFQRDNRMTEGPANNGHDRARGTIEQIANIEPCSWKKYWRNVYTHSRKIGQIPQPRTTSRSSAVSCKIVLVRGNQAWGKSSGCNALRSRETTRRASSDYHGKALMSRRYPGRHKGRRHG